MSKKMLIGQLLLTAFVISWAIPSVILGVTEDFKPQKANRWTGTLKRGPALEIFDGSIIVGFAENAWPNPDYTFRGWAAFDISDLPANACVSRIQLLGDCFMAGASDHILMVHKLTEFPINAPPLRLWDNMEAGTWYNECSNCMSSTGDKTMDLLRGAKADLESAAQGTGLRWFAVGFLELGENAAPGIWHGNAIRKPILRVTYTVPYQTAPTVSISTFQPCVGERYTVSWSSLPAATSYDIREDGGNWANVGLINSIDFRQTTAGPHTFAVRARNNCGIGPSSQPISINVITVPVAPANVWTLNSSQCINSKYTVHWDPVTGADSYEIREDNGRWTNVGTSTGQAFIHSTVGQHNYSVRGVNICGNGQVRTSSLVSVLGTPATPGAPETSNPTPCPNQSVTIEWSAVTDAVKYRLHDFIGQVDVYAGPNTSWTAPHPAGSYEYWLKVFNGCGWSGASGPLSVNTKQPLATPGALTSDQNPAYVRKMFTLDWDPVPGAVIYRLWHNGNILMDSVATPQISMTINIADEYRFTLMACDECGCSEMGPELVLIVDDPTAVEEIGDSNLPDSYALSQNYPNPFNPETRIEFSLMRSGYVELTVYDILGKTVRLLVSHQLSAGHKVVVWDGRDNSGRRVSSGAYLYKLTAGEYTEAKKMILIK